MGDREKKRLVGALTPWNGCHARNCQSIMSPGAQYNMAALCAIRQIAGQTGIDAHARETSGANVPLLNGTIVPPGVGSLASLDALAAIIDEL